MRSKRSMRAGIAALVLGLAAGLMLAGCAGTRATPAGLGGDPLEQARGPDDNARLYTDLIRQMIAQDRLYAALAHLQAREQEFGVSDELRLLRADILRRMGDDAPARALYEQLIDTPYAGQAHHGLGLLVSNSDPAASLGHLEKAVQRVPTDARMRNDLGYALLRRGDYAQARLQLATAYQLDEGNELNRNNYILLLLVEGDDRRAARIAARDQVGDRLMRQLRSQARTIAGHDEGTTGRPIPATPRPQAPAAGPIGGGGG